MLFLEPRNVIALVHELLRVGQTENFGGQGLRKRAGKGRLRLTTMTRNEKTNLRFSARDSVVAGPSVDVFYPSPWPGDF